MTAIKQKCRGVRAMLAVGVMSLAISGGPAWAEADGPDAWRVVDVAANDSLNARMGPGTEYPVIGRFMHDARGLRQITCVPLVTAEHYFKMTEAERADLPPRWCLMQSADNSVKGWVAQRYLAEDQALTAEQATDGPDALLAEAERLVQRLYTDHQRALSGAFTSPLAPARAGDFFTEGLAASIARGALQADPLFDGQDSEIMDLHVALDAEQPMFRGMITVNVDYRNFGHPRRAVVRLRAEDGEPRIIRIEHEEWVFE